MPELRVIASCNSVDNTVKFTFDCTKAFAKLNEYEIDALLSNQWICDKFMAAYYASMFFQVNNTSDTNMDLNYQITIDEATALEWLKKNRPYWWEQFMKDKDLQEALTYEAKNPN